MATKSETPPLVSWIRDLLRGSGPVTSAMIVKAIGDVDSQLEQLVVRRERINRERAAALIDSTNEEIRRFELELADADLDAVRLTETRAELTRRLDAAADNERAARVGQLLAQAGVIYVRSGKLLDAIESAAKKLEEALAAYHADVDQVDNLERECVRLDEDRWISRDLSKMRYVFGFRFDDARSETAALLRELEDHYVGAHRPPEQAISVVVDDNRDVAPVAADGGPRIRVRQPDGSWMDQDEYETWRALGVRARIISRGIE